MIKNIAQIETALNKKIPINTHNQKQNIIEEKIKIMPNTNSSTIKVQKRHGKLEKLDINKIHFVVEESCEGLTGVSPSQIEMNANIQFYDGMSTKLIKSFAERTKTF